jgi:hypothetical protein
MCAASTTAVRLTPPQDVSERLRPLLYPLCSRQLTHTKHCPSPCRANHHIRQLRQHHHCHEPSVLTRAAARLFCSAPAGLPAALPAAARSAGLPTGPHVSAVHVPPIPGLCTPVCGARTLPCRALPGGALSGGSVPAAAADCAASWAEDRVSALLSP